MPVPAPSVEELVQTVRRTSLPTVLCEGESDVQVLRCLEAALGSTQVSFMPCGGRGTLLAIFDRRSEFADKRTAFLADKDTWVFTGVPPGYEVILFTWGYSIENDVLAGAGIEQLFTAGERRRYETALHEIVRWSAFEINNLLQGGEAHLATHINQVLTDCTERVIG